MDMPGMSMPGMGSNGNHGGGSSSGGDTSIFGGPVLPNLFYMQKIYWTAVGSAIALATFVNLYNQYICYKRISAAGQVEESPAKPRTFFDRKWATLTAIVREISYASPPLIWITKRDLVGLYPFGHVSLVLANVTVLLILCFYKFDLRDQWQWEDVGYRTGFISVCQLPLIFLLAGKKNIIGYLTGSSYERLNLLHRWVARCLLMTVIIHMGYWFTDWARYDYISQKIATDSITQRGLGAGSVLLWIVLSSMTPIRGWNYEVFIIQHLVSYTVFIVMVYLHVPSENHVWIWIPVGLYLFDRSVRVLNTLYINVSKSSLLCCKAEFTPLEGRVTRVTIREPPISWKAGQHVLLSCHSLLPFQSHPFTISSLPSDGKMEFLIRAKQGGTKRLFGHAEKCQVLPAHRNETRSSKSVVIEGPYGRIRPLQQFDTVTFIAGGMGAAFVVPLLRDLVQQWKQPNDRPGFLAAHTSKRVGVVTRRIRLVWVVRFRAQLTWFKEKLEELTETNTNLVLDVECYITCDEGMVGDETPVVHGKIEQVDSDSESEKNEGNKKIKEESYVIKETESVSSLSTRSSKSLEPKETCGPDGTCCCRDTILSSDHDATDVVCQCCGSLDENEFNDSPNIPIRTGRPSLRDIIRTDVEHAKGESAVVVCGPNSLARDVRQISASLSDERGVHKGTLAQGIWCWAEGFSY